MGDNGKSKTLDEYDLRYFFQSAFEISPRQTTRTERIRYNKIVINLYSRRLY